MASPRTDTPETTTPALLKGGWLLLSRFTWVTTALISIGALSLFIPYAYDNLRRMGDWRRAGMFMLGMRDSLYAGYYVALMLIFALVCMGVGMFIYWRKADDRMALLTSLMLMTFGVMGVGMLHPTVANSIFGSNTALATLLSITTVTGSLFLFTSLFVFPDGRFVPEWTKWAAIVVFVYVGWLLLPEDFPLRLNHLSPTIFAVVPFVFLGVGVYAQMYRYFRVASATQREQTKELIYGLRIVLSLIVVVRYIIPLLIPAVQPPNIPAAALAYEMIGALIFMSLLIVPIAIARAILRYRLWSIVLSNKAR